MQRERDHTAEIHGSGRNQLRIPRQIQPGIYRLTAMGRVSGGDVVSEGQDDDLVWVESIRHRSGRIHNLF